MLKANFESQRNKHSIFSSKKKGKVNVFANNGKLHIIEIVFNYIKFEERLNLQLSYDSVKLNLSHNSCYKYSKLIFVKREFEEIIFVNQLASSDDFCGNFANAIPRQNCVEFTFYLSRILTLQLNMLDFECFYHGL